MLEQALSDKASELRVVSANVSDTYTDKVFKSRTCREKIFPGAKVEG
jgi:hypothetical protein